MLKMKVCQEQRLVVVLKARGYMEALSRMYLTWKVPDI